MNNKATLLKVLFYYDVPQLILVGDENEDIYLCILFDDEDMLYSGIRISPGRLGKFLRSEIDLRDLYLHPEDDRYVHVSCDEGGFYILERIQGIPEEEKLPEYGFTLPHQLEQDEQRLLQDLARYRHPIVKLGVSDVYNNHTIPLVDLAEIGTRYQKLITRTQRKLGSPTEDPETELVVYGMQAASFNLLMYVNSEFELFSSPVDSALDLVGQLLSYDSPESFKSKIQDIRGHALKSLRVFLEYLVEHNYSLKYQWMSKMNSGVNYPKFDRMKLQEAYSILQETQELERVLVDVSGRITAASSENGTWTIKSSGRKPISGRCETPSLLDGVVIKKAIYEIKYEEIITFDIASVKDKVERMLLEITLKADQDSEQSQDAKSETPTQLLL